jgi:chromosome segregation protein
VRAQTLIVRKPVQRWPCRSRVCRCLAAPGQAARREATETQSRAHELQVETLRLTQLAEQTRARSQQLATPTLAEVDAQLDELQERRVTAEARFEELDMQLADSQERQAQLGDKVIEAERKLKPAASSSAAWNARPRKQSFHNAACRRAAPSCSAPSKPQHNRPRLRHRRSSKAPDEELPACQNAAAPKAVCKMRWP